MNQKIDNFPNLQRQAEKRAIQSMDFMEKVSYYSKKKSTWIAISSIIFAVASQDYATAVTTLMGLF